MRNSIIDVKLSMEKNEIVNSLDLIPLLLLMTIIKHFHITK